MESLDRSYTEISSERRRRILHFNVTEHPASDWIVPQLREALSLHVIAANATTGSGNQVLYIISPTKLLILNVNPTNRTPGFTIAEQ